MHTRSIFICLGLAWIASAVPAPLNINLGAYSPALVVGDGAISFGGAEGAEGAREGAAAGGEAAAAGGAAGAAGEAGGEAGAEAAQQQNIASIQVRTHLSISLSLSLPLSLSRAGPVRAVD